MDKKRLEFAVFCASNVAEFLNLNGGEVYFLLAEEICLELGISN